jgi:hypothetical protein
MAKTRYFIPYSYTISGQLEVIADSQAEAVELATDAAPCPEPTDMGRQSFDDPQICGATFSYVQDSFQVDEDMLEQEEVSNDEDEE